VEPARAASILRAVAQEGQNAPRQSRDIMDVLNAYMRWAEATEAQLASLTLDVDAVTMLQTQRYWQLRDVGAQVAAGVNRDRLLRPWPLLQSEVDLQVAALDALARDIDARIERAGAQRGEPTVLDTNILLHYQRPDYVPWPTVLNRASVRLVVPLRVVEELDAKKYSRNDLAQRARNVLPWLETTVIGGPGLVRENTTIEVPVDPARRSRPDDADREILDTCHELRQFGSQRVTLVTGDTAMRLRAHAEAIPTVSMPDAYLPQPPGG
jgi:rRNA-processing protein FCF1